MTSEFRVLGIDPGIANTGYGLVIECSGKMRAGAHGFITTRSATDMSHRLDKLYSETKSVILELAPDVVVLEELFFNTNQKSAIAVGQARGVILLACNHAGAGWAEYTPLEVKQAVVGNGNASKEQVQYMVTMLLKLAEPPKSLHACDALAMAICHLQGRRFRELTGT
ncbi:MAG: crossover junction endodeoxyribonuclease RuvC [Candidatus Geothermincolia bacterium]